MNSNGLNKLPSKTVSINVLNDCVKELVLYLWSFLIDTVVHPDRSSLTKLVSDIKESQNIASLHNQITACDSILEVSG